MMSLLAQFIFGVLAVYGALTLAYQVGAAAWIWYGRRQVRIADRAKAARRESDWKARERASLEDWQDQQEAIRRLIHETQKEAA